MPDLESVQQSARARGLRVRIETDDLAELRTFTLVDASDRPTKLCDVSLSVIAAELARERSWAEPPPPWQSLLARAPQRPGPVQRRPRALGQE